MGLESIQEVANMLARSGSFYYRNLSPDGITVARKLSQLYTNCRVFTQFKAAEELVASGGYFNDAGRVIRFKDSDIEYFGTKYALQHRDTSDESAEPQDELALTGYTALLNQDNKLLSELDREARITQILAFPFTDWVDDTEAQVVVGYRSTMRYGLYIDKDTFVTTITLPDGTLLFNGVDFLAYYGLILFTKNPAELFPGYKFIASSCTIRRRNLLSFTLSVDEVYGPVDKIMEYYRVAQSPVTFYLAASQACGLCVVPQDCTVLSREPLHKGCSYITTCGKLDAPYGHIMYETGAELSKDMVIGGSELFSVVLPNAEIPSDIGELSLDYILPVRGLTAPNEVVQITSNGLYRPAFNGTNINKYYEYVKAANGGVTPTSSTPATNAIEYVVNELVPGRAMILRINRSRMYRDMQLRLDRFIERELPIGVALLTENMKNDF